MRLSGLLKLSNLFLEFLVAHFLDFFGDNAAVIFIMLFHVAPFFYLIKLDIIIKAMTTVTIVQPAPESKAITAIHPNTELRQFSFYQRYHGQIDHIYMFSRILARSRISGRGTTSPMRYSRGRYSLFRRFLPSYSIREHVSGNFCRIFQIFLKKVKVLLAAGENRHSEPGKNRQKRSK